MTFQDGLLKEGMEREREMLGKRLNFSLNNLMLLSKLNISHLVDRMTN